MRLFLISFCSVMVLAMILAMSRFWGLSLPYQEFKHPFFDQKALFTVQVENFGQANDAIKMDPDVVLWTDARVTKDQKIVVVSTATSDAFIKKENLGSAFIGNKIYYYDWSLLKTYFVEAKTLGDFVAQFPHQRFIINVVDNSEKVHELVIQELKPHSPEKRFLIQSETDVIVKSIKDQEPFWLYGTSLPELTRLITFGSIGLQPAISIRGDVMIAPLNIRHRKFVNEDVLTEVKRRMKKVLLGPIKNDAEMMQSVSWYQKNLVDGFIVENPKQIKLISAQIGLLK